MRKALFLSLVLAGSVALPAMAQDKKADKKTPMRAQKVLIDNDRVRATESTFKPGEANPMQERAYRIVRVLKGTSAMERTHSTGKVDKLEYKEGGVYGFPAENASTKNVGKSEVTIYTVSLKQAK
jgi:hypothetical protein